MDGAETPVEGSSPWYEYLQNISVQSNGFGDMKCDLKLETKLSK